MISIDSNQGFAAYSLPGVDDYVLLCGKFARFEGFVGDEGFLISPFDNQSKDALILIPDRYEMNASFALCLTECRGNYSMTKEEYLSKTEIILNRLNNADDPLEKVVFSRIIRIESDNINVYSLFMDLKKAYPSAFVYIFNVPDEGCWIGASPERLLSWDKDLVSTSAVASTKPISEKTNWNDKDIKEQRYVVDFIEDIIRSYGWSYSKKIGEKIAGPVRHLCTDFLISGVQNLEALLEQIHPTPAVCGHPRDQARSMISNAEPHERKYYCGYLGPIDGEHKGDLFVNLRCMEVDKAGGNIYVGGGLIKESMMETEWEETEHKAETLLSVMRTVYI